MKITSLIIFLPLLAGAQTEVLTRSYDNGRNGANTTETKLTPMLVGAKGLKRIKSLKINDDPRIEAQPLYVPGLTIKGAKHNVVFVASMGNHVFAFDADAPSGKDLLWTSTLLSPPYKPIKKPQDGPKATNVDLYGINVLWGILSTPVIDIDANQMYLTNWTEGTDPNSPVLLLHRIGLADGKEIGQGQRLTGALNDSSGNPVMDARGHAVVLNANQKQRAALLLSPLHGPNKTLFIGITGGETPGDPHGWLVAVDVNSFRQTDAIPTTQQGFGGGIWQGAQGPAGDDKGNIYVMTGNGGFNAQKGPKDTNPGRIGNFAGTTDFAESFVRFNYQSGTGGIGKSGATTGKLTLADWFIPFADANRTPNGNPDYQDQDLGSGGPILPTGTTLLMGAGKDGILYVMDRNNLGKKAPGDISALKQPPIYLTFNGLGLQTNPPQDFPLGGPEPGQGAPKKTHHLHASAVYWIGPNGPRLFDQGENESLRAWSVDANTGKIDFLGKSAEIASRKLATDATSQGGMTGGMVSLSSNGTNNGIVWTLAPIDDNANKKVVAGIARAYDATTLDTTKNADGTAKLKLLWDSTKANVKFNFSKFCPPMVADGRLYVPTYDGHVDVYALNP